MGQQDAGCSQVHQGMGVTSSLLSGEGGGTV